MKENEFKKLEDLAQPLINFLEESGNPHNQIIIDNERVRVVQDVVSIPSELIKKA